MAIAKLTSTPIIEYTFASTSLTFTSEDPPIGHGAFGTVYKALHNDWGCYVAFKKIEGPHRADRQLDFLFEFLKL